MDAPDRIAEEFNRLLGFGYERINERRFAEQVVWYVAITRCEKDMAGFESVFEQGLTAADLTVLIEGLRVLDETDLAEEFARGLELLQQEGFYPQRDFKAISPNAQREIAEIGERVGDALWNLDAKMVGLLDLPG